MHRTAEHRNQQETSLLSVPLHVIQCQTSLCVDAFCAFQVAFRDVRSTCGSRKRCGVDLALLQCREMREGRIVEPAAEQQYSTLRITEEGCTCEAKLSIVDAS